MGGDDELVGIGLALLIAAGVMWATLGGVDGTAAARTMQDLAWTVASAIHNAAAAFGI